MQSDICRDTSSPPDSLAAPGSSQLVHTPDVSPQSSGYAETLPQFDLSSFGPPQRRRVNPESLAARLGPDLVAELEKHIVPGNIEMPSFSIRRDIQVKFAIDRRHIYDFYHSRGLRCLKDEKPARKEPGFWPEVCVRSPSHATTIAQLLKARARPARTLPPPPPPPAPPSPKLPQAKRRRTHPSIVTPSLAKPHRAPRKSKVARKQLSPSPASDDPPLNYYSDAYPTLDLPELTSDDLTSDFIPPTNPLDEDFSIDHDIGDVHYAYRSRPLFEHMAELQEMDCSVDSSPSFDNSVASSSPASCFTSSPASTAYSPATSDFSCADECAPVKPDAISVLRSAREQYYDWLAAIFGPAVGIQESVGTYRTYMDRQKDLYFERLLRGESQRGAVSGDKSGDSDGRTAGSTKVDPHSEDLPPLPGILPLPSHDVGILSTGVLDNALDGMFPHLDRPHAVDYWATVLNPQDSPVLRSRKASTTAAGDDPELTKLDACDFDKNDDPTPGFVTADMRAPRMRVPTCSSSQCDREWSRRVRRRTFSATGNL
ncbi:hypothetical protein FA95DRAFT_579303 [Auriscalpium vulgare]|uniref:Uncharacterized protein n=1 Tax=Auriscalpium vulgare TaxID=40419 RepID=A0ACB8S3N8_9AGAM|nr:hypothetical protein FA95DRAFT_579303 [Auriscalpium vulgare]